MHHAILTGALVDVRLLRPVGPRACSLWSATHGNHAAVQQSDIGPQLCIDKDAVVLAVPVNIIPLTLANWIDQHPVLPAPSRWSQERASQPEKIESVTSYKNEYK
jgi:hypothetical protein